MSWQPLGTITIDDWNWKLFNQPDLNARIFRVTQDYTGDRHPYGWLSLCSRFSNDAYDLWRRIYPQKDAPTILNLTIPDHYQEIGLITRYIIARPTIRTRWYSDSNWTISLDHWTPATPLPDTNEQLSEVLSDLSRIENKIDAIP